MNQVATRTPSPSASPNATPTATRGPAASHTPSRTAVALKVRVSGNHLVNGAGSTVRLLGANRSGTQYACLEGSGIFDGPSDSASIATMKAWGMTAVRVSLNEDCWLGINGVPAAYSGANYQAAIGGFVDRLNAAGLYVILDLHSNAPGTAKALDQKPMADRDHSPAFWAGVAGHFKDRPAVVFDLYNEPYPDSNHNTTAAWTCIRDGGTCPGVPFTAAGSQEMVNAIRGAGATNVVLVGGPQYAGVVDRWTEFKPADPAGQLAASIHIYYNNPADGVGAVLSAVLLGRDHRAAQRNHAGRHRRGRGARLRLGTDDAAAALGRHQGCELPGVVLVHRQLCRRAGADLVLRRHAQR